MAEITRTAVLAELVRRGYGIDHRYGCAFGLNEATTILRKADGLARRKGLGGLTERQWKQIRETSIGVINAADRAEAICLGKQDPGVPKGNNMTTQDVEKLAEKKAQQMLESMGLTPEVLAKVREMAGVEDEPEVAAAPRPAPAPEPERQPEVDKPHRELTEREIQALDLRESGMKFREVAEEMGVTTSRANQLFNSAKKKVRALQNGTS